MKTWFLKIIAVMLLSTVGPLAWADAPPGAPVLLYTADSLHSRIEGRDAINKYGSSMAARFNRQLRDLLIASGHPSEAVDLTVALKTSPENAIDVAFLSSTVGRYRYIGEASWETTDGVTFYIVAHFYPLIYANGRVSIGKEDHGKKMVLPKPIKEMSDAVDKHAMELHQHLMSTVLGK